MKIQLLIISLLFMTNGFCARGLDKAFQLLPQPQSVELLPGKGIMYTDLKFVSAASDTLVPILGALTDVLPRAGHMGKGLFLQLSESNVPDSPEGYVLEVNDKGVTVTARTEAGASSPNARSQCSCPASASPECPPVSESCRACLLR